MIDDMETLPDFSPLSDGQIESLSESQKQIFLQLDEADRQFFAENFTTQALGKALDRRWETLQSRNRLVEFENRLKESLHSDSSRTSPQPSLTGSDLAIGAAGIAGAVGIGTLASRIAPTGKASWRGAQPGDLVAPLAAAFARQEKTDIQFETPTAEGVLHGAVYIRTAHGLIPGLTLTLTPVGATTEVYISKVSSESVMEAIKHGSQKLLDLIKDGLILSARRGGVGSLFDLAGSMVNSGVDIARIVKDLDLEDKAWEVVQRAAEPLQKIYDERKKLENAARASLEQAWDDYYHCPKCRVSFGAEDAECRVCGTARPEKPALPDPRLPQE